MLATTLAAAACTFGAHGALPDHGCTPGAFRSRATVAQICTPGYSSRTRKVSSATKRKDYAEYGQSGPHPFPEWEVDHLIPLELGGSNSLRNLWPEHNPGAKDRVENELHDRVCAGRMSLRVAQRRIARDWRSALS
jgi:hypothetical protein